MRFCVCLGHVIKPRIETEQKENEAKQNEIELHVIVEFGAFAFIFEPVN